MSAIQGYTVAQTQQIAQFVASARADVRTWQERVVANARDARTQEALARALAVR